MSGDNSGEIGTRIKEELIPDMETYDGLDPIVRLHLKFAPLKFSAIEYVEFERQYGRRAMLGAIEIWSPDRNKIKKAKQSARLKGY